MDATPTLVERWHLPDHGYALLEADLQPLFEQYAHSLQEYGLRQGTSEERDFCHHLLAALVLWSSFVPEETSTAWSILLPRREWRLFACADGSESQCVLRWSPCEAEHRHAEPTFDSQTQRPGTPIQRSVFAPDQDDPIALVEQYFERSQQSRGTLRSDSAGTRFQLLFRLHDNQEDSWPLLREGPGLLDLQRQGNRRPFPPQRSWHYECGCEPQRLCRELLVALSGDVEALFGDQAAVETECPRCGRPHRLQRP